LRVPKLVVLCALVPLALAVVACGSDDGSDVRTPSTDAAAPTGPSGGTGLNPAELQTITTDDPVVQAAVADYTDYVNAQVDEIVARTTVFTDAVRAGDVAAAKAAYAPSREPWESIEPIAGLIPDIDGAVDSRVDDFKKPTNPQFTGWHRLEYLLWVENTTAGGTRFADQLDADLATLKTDLATLEIPPAAVALGASELIEEVSQGKITGEEDRYSKTDLWDFAANVDGAKKVIEILTPALQASDPDLLAKIEAGFAELDTSLAPLEKGDGYVLYCQVDDDFPSKLCPKPTVTKDQVNTMKVQLAGLAEDLALVPGALKLS